MRQLPYSYFRAPRDGRPVFALAVLAGAVLVALRGDAETLGLYVLLVTAVRLLVAEVFRPRR